MSKNDDPTEAAGDWVLAATQAKSAFEQLKVEMDRAAESQVVPQPGDLVGDRFRVESELGEGGFGNVYLVKHDMLGRRFAMKVLNTRIARDPDWVARFREEARATSLIGHENIVYVTDFGQDEKYGYFFVMEFLDGRPLDEIIAEEGPLDPPRVLRFVHAAASALGAVHELGIVHCDLKPSNAFSVVRPGRDELWKILDFGTSTIVMNAVETEALYGTPRYMAPEQSVGLDVDARADQFALGCIVYEMLTGQLPWDVRNWLQAMPENRKRRPPPLPSSLCEECPSGWDEVIMRAISVKPEERYETIDAFARALEASAAIEWTPSVDPLDVRRSVTPGEFEPTMTAPVVAIAPAKADETEQPTLEESSLVIDVESPDALVGETRRVFVTFKSRERLVREYRRNLAVGGIFIPSEDLLPLRAAVELELLLEPSAERCLLRASVVGHELRTEAGRGFGLAIDPQERAKLDAFLELIRGPKLSASDVISLGRNPTAADALSTSEGFLLSRIGAGLPFAGLRVMCAGLPFDVEELVTSLLSRGILVVAGRSGQADGAPESSDVPGVTTAAMTSKQVQMVLERVDFHREQANFLGASDVLRKALDVSPNEAVFHYRLALLRTEFGQELQAARTAARRAVELAPGNDEYRALLDVLQQKSENR